MVNEDIKEEIKNRIKLSEIISQKIDLKRKSNETFLGLCPFHKEKTPSFNVNDNKGFYHCFGCQKHGDIFNFIMEYENINFLEALEYLANKIGLSLSKSTLRSDDNILKKYKILNLATDFFINQLDSIEDIQVLAYYLKIITRNNLIKVCKLTL